MNNIQTLVGQVNETLSETPYEANYNQTHKQIEVQRGKSKLHTHEWQDLLFISASLPLISQIREKLAEDQPDVHSFDVVVTEQVPNRIRDVIEEVIKETVFEQQTS